MSAELNPSQRSAVEHSLGPLLVLAGAGSGKTRVVTQRVARLIERGVAARNILAMTFTNKAAGEMHERVCSLVGSKVAKELKVCTFHRFGLDVLGAETRALHLRGSSFAIVDQADAASIVREILRHVRTGKNLDIYAILTRISNAKNAFIEPEAWRLSELEGKGVDEYDELASIVYPRYIAALKSLQAFDFDDLICEVVNLWKRRPDVLERWRMRFRYVIVDEYQDTNRAQLELVRLLAGEHKNVCVVGDDDQSIYAWRGADVRNILDFERHFTGAKVVKLEHNYRSSKSILDVANAVLARSTGRRHKKTLIAAKLGGDKVQSVICADPDVESSFVGTEISRLIERQGVRPKDIAVLYRSNLQSAPIESALKERQIPFRLVGGTQFYERKEVKDICAYLRTALDPSDEVSLRRVLNYPARGIGDAAIQKLSANATARDSSLWAIVSRPHTVKDLPSPAVEGCRAFARIVEGVRRRFEQNEPSAEITKALIAEAGIAEDVLVASSGQIAARRLGNIDSLVQLFARRDARFPPGAQAFAEFLRLISLREQEAEESAEDRVTLTTMHGAKGLEFRFVFVIGLEEGLMPHLRSLTERVTDAAPVSGSDDEEIVGHSIDEERRLFYVAVTRAKERLYLSRSKQRGARGKIIARTPSRFLLDIPAELLEERLEMTQTAPELNQTKSGAASVLAAISFGKPNFEAAGGDFQPPMMRRPQAR